MDLSSQDLPFRDLLRRCQNGQSPEGFTLYEDEGLAYVDRMMNKLVHGNVIKYYKGFGGIVGGLDRMFTLTPRQPSRQCSNTGETILIPELFEVEVSVDPDSGHSFGIILSKVAMKPLATMQGDNFDRRKHVQVQMTVGPGCPDYTRQPSFRKPDTHRDNPLPGEQHPRRREDTGLRTRPFRLHRNGKVSSDWTDSHSTRDGDFLVFFDASSLAVVVRPLDDGRYGYMGPVMINRGAWLGSFSDRMGGDPYWQRIAGREAGMMLEMRQWLVSNFSQERHKQFTLV